MTALASILTERRIPFHVFCRKAKLHDPKAYKLKAGKIKVGPEIQRRVSLALEAPTTELFDADGWPLPAQNVAEGEQL